MRLAGKPVLVTGGGSGIGRAITERFATEYAQLTVAGRTRRGSLPARITGGVSGMRDMSMTSTAAAPITIRIVGHTLPGRDFGDRRNVHVGIQRKAEAVDLVPGDAERAEFTIPVDVVPGKDARCDFRGPFVQGKAGGRFLYLTWGNVDMNGAFAMFRRLKIDLSGIDEELIATAQEPDAVLEGSLSLSDQRGEPVCSSLPPGWIRWAVIGPAV